MTIGEREVVAVSSISSTLDLRLQDVKIEKVMPRFRPRVVVFDAGKGRESSIAVLFAWEC